MTKQPTLILTYLYPDLMNTYGDRGNMLALQYRAAAQGIQLLVRSVSLGESWPAGQTNIYLFGGGQDQAQQVVARDLENKLEVLQADLAAGVPMLAICGGYQLLGKSYLDPDGNRAQGLGVLNVETRAGRERMIGNILLEATALIPGQSVLGFENHGGRTYLGAGARPFAKVIRGFGNNDTDHPRNEGCVEGNILGTYLHGSLLPKNPALTDWFIATAMTQKMPQFKLKPVISAWEERAFDQAKSRL